MEKGCGLKEKIIIIKKNKRNAVNGWQVKRQIGDKEKTASKNRRVAKKRGDLSLD